MSRIAVITPFYRESLEWILRCNQSVKNQKIKCDHIIISDGPYHLNLEGKVDAKLLQSSNWTGNNGNTQRFIGTNYAISEEYDYLAYLDADNWFHPDHIETMLYVLDQDDIVCGKRTFHKEDGTFLNCREDADVLNYQHTDTSCYLISKNIFKIINIWDLIPKDISQYCDRIFFYNLVDKNIKRKFCEVPTVAFTTNYENHFHNAKLPLPNNVKIIKNINQGISKYFSNIENQKAFQNIFGFTFRPNP